MCVCQFRHSGIWNLWLFNDILTMMSGLVLLSGQARRLVESRHLTRHNHLRSCPENPVIPILYQRVGFEPTLAKMDGFEPSEPFSSMLFKSIALNQLGHISKIAGTRLGLVYPDNESGKLPFTLPRKAPGETRTHSLFLTRELRCQLRYRSIGARGGI